MNKKLYFIISLIITSTYVDADSSDEISTWDSIEWSFELGNILFPDKRLNILHYIVPPSIFWYSMYTYDVPFSSCPLDLVLKNYSTSSINRKIFLRTVLTIVYLKFIIICIFHIPHSCDGSKLSQDNKMTIKATSR